MDKKWSSAPILRVSRQDLLKFGCEVQKNQEWFPSLWSERLEKWDSFPRRKEGGKNMIMTGLGGRDHELVHL